MKIFTIIRKMAGGAGGGTNWRPITALGVALQTALQWLGAIASGISLQQCATTATMPAAVGIGITQTAAGATTPPQTAGVALSPVGNLGAFLASMGAELQQVTIGLVRTKGAATAVNTRQSSSIDWANPNNAAGEHNGSSATLTATALAAADARLDFTQTASVNKSDLTISSVKLRFHYSITLGVLQTVSNVLSYAIGAGSYTVLATDTGAVDHLAAGREFDITAAIAGNWANIDNLKPRQSATLSANAVSGSVTCDAVEVIVNGSTTMIL